jgi:methyl-accepting chemotaxis protein
MGASINEIAQSASEAAQVARSAVRAAESTTATIIKLGTSAQEIGHVVVTDVATGSSAIAGNIAGVAEAAATTTEGVSQTQQAALDLARRSAQLQTVVARSATDTDRCVLGTPGAATGRLW